MCGWHHNECRVQWSLKPKHTQDAICLHVDNSRADTGVLELEQSPTSCTSSQLSIPSNTLLYNYYCMLPDSIWYNQGNCFSSNLFLSVFHFVSFLALNNSLLALLCFPATGTLRSSPAQFPCFVKCALFCLVSIKILLYLSKLTVTHQLSNFFHLKII